LYNSTAIGLFFVHGSFFLDRFAFMLMRSMPCRSDRRRDVRGVYLRWRDFVTAIRTMWGSEEVRGRKVEGVSLDATSAAGLCGYFC
jgi:hypothetical protein